MHAIPSWTQPVPRAGNWDDVVLPVVARKNGLNDQFEMADGKPTPKKTSSFVAPAPGTFGFKYRGSRDDDEEDEEEREGSVQTDEFGRPLAGFTISEEEEEEGGSQSDPPESSTTAYQTNEHDKIPMQILEPPSTPPPFSSYAPASEKLVPEPVGIRRPLEMDREDMHDRGAGCCKCVVM